MQALARRAAARHHRSDARHPLAADPLRRRAPAARAAARAPRRGRGGAAARRRHRGARRASCTCRCRGTIRRRSSRSSKYMQSVRPDAPWCPSNIEFIRRINGLASVDDVQRHRLRRALPRARPRRRLPRRARRDAARSAPPPGHDEVQPGAHLDAGERGRHRRRLPVRLRHGRARRLPVRRPHLPDVEPVSRDRGVPRADALAAALLRPDPLLPGERAGAARRARRVPARPGDT